MRARVDDGYLQIVKTGKQRAVYMHVCACAYVCMRLKCVYLYRRIHPFNLLAKLSMPANRGLCMPSLLCVYAYVRMCFFHAPF